MYSHIYLVYCFYIFYFYKKLKTKLYFILLSLKVLDIYILKKHKNNIPCFKFYNFKIIFFGNNEASLIFILPAVV